MMAIFRYWRHFLALEADFAATSRYVEFSQDNFKTYSIEFVKLLLAIGSEVDVVAKDVCKALDPAGTYGNINQYRDCISVRNTIFNEKVLAPDYGLEFQPWKAWHGDKNPSWWKAYNDVKHERSVNYRDANFENCANAVSGLFAMVLYCYAAEESRDTISGGTTLLEWHQSYNEPLMRLPYHVYAFQPPFDKSKVPLR